MEMTLGLWHLDGNLKDSSYWNNTPGTAYNNKFTDGLYTNGKIFSENTNDFLELKLDKVKLPSSWTLEWCEYVPSFSTSTNYGDDVYYPTGSGHFGPVDYNLCPSEEDDRPVEVCV